MKHLLVFFAVFALDCAFAWYIIATARKSAGWAAGWAAIIMGLNGYLAVAWNSDPATIPAGTWASIRWVKA